MVKKPAIQLFVEKKFAPFGMTNKRCGTLLSLMW